MLSGAARKFMMATGRGQFLFRRICTGLQYAEFLRRHGGFFAVGHHCYISPGANVTDPAYVKIGNNVRINACAIFGHDGAVNMVNRAFGHRLDSVGKVEIRDNVFIGYGAIILPNVTIGPNAIVAAGSVVTRDVPEGSVVAGSPAKPVSTVDAYVAKMQAQNGQYPWRDLLENKVGEFDASIEGQLVRARIEHFYPGEKRRVRHPPSILREIGFRLMIPLAFLALVGVIVALAILEQVDKFNERRATS
jgi:acetyltransferase-like isoleucine patch superfamily enzyme